MANAVPEPREIPDQPLARSLTFAERVRELEQITTHDTATEIARSEYGLGGDTIELPLEPEERSPDGQLVDAG